MMQFPGGHPAMAAAFPGGFQQDPFAFQGGAFPQGQMGHLTWTVAVILCDGGTLVVASREE